MDSTAAPPPAASEQGVLPGRPAAERLSAAVQQQLNLESVKARAVGLYKAISRILEDFDRYSRTNASPKWSVLSAFFLSRILEEVIFTSVSVSILIWCRNLLIILVSKSGRQEALGQFSMVSMELFNIVEDIKKVSKAFVVYPRNVNAENATSN